MSAEPIVLQRSMTDPMNELVHTLSAIERGATPAALARAVRAFAAPRGYDRFVLFSCRPDGPELISQVHWAEGDWFGDGAQVDAKTYLQACPVNHHILETDRPFFWTKRGSAAAPIYRVVPSPRGLGVHGWQVPVYGPPGLVGAMSFGGTHIDDALATQAGHLCLRRQSLSGEAVGDGIARQAAIQVVGLLQVQSAGGGLRGVERTRRRCIDAWHHADAVRLKQRFEWACRAAFAGPCALGEFPAFFQDRVVDQGPVAPIGKVLPGGPLTGWGWAVVALLRGLLRCADHFARVIARVDGVLVCQLRLDGRIRFRGVFWVGALGVYRPLGELLGVDGAGSGVGGLAYQLGGLCAVVLRGAGNR